MIDARLTRLGGFVRTFFFCLIGLDALALRLHILDAIPPGGAGWAFFLYIFGNIAALPWTLLFPDSLLNFEDKNLWAIFFIMPTAVALNVALLWTAAWPSPVRRKEG